MDDERASIPLPGSTPACPFVATRPSRPRERKGGMRRGSRSPTPGCLRAGSPLDTIGAGYRPGTDDGTAGSTAQHPSLHHPAATTCRTFVRLFGRHRVARPCSIRVVRGRTKGASPRVPGRAAPGTCGTVSIDLRIFSSKRSRAAPVIRRISLDYRNNDLLR